MKNITDLIFLFNINIYSWEQSNDLTVCVGECGDWEDIDVNGGSQDKTDQVTQSAQESQGTGSYIWFWTWTSEEISWNI